MQNLIIDLCAEIKSLLFLWSQLSFHFVYKFQFQILMTVKLHYEYQLQNYLEYR